MNFKNLWPKEEEFFYNKVLDLFPPRIRKDLLTIPFPDNISTKGIYAYGDNGTGKTLHICHRLVGNIHRGTDRLKLGFISSLDLLHRLKDFERADELFTVYSLKPYLAIDDLGVEKVTDWAYQMLYRIINHRYEHQRVTYFSSNLSLDELGQKFGDMRIPSRIQAMCEVVKFTGEDYRSKK